MKDFKTYTTLDSYLSGYLSLKGFPPTLIPEGNKIVFSFPLNEDLNKALDEYHSGDAVSALLLISAIKRLKSLIFTVRRENGEQTTTRN